MTKMEGRIRENPSLENMDDLFDSLRQTYASQETPATQGDVTGRLSALSDNSLGIIDLDKVPEASVSKFLVNSLSVSANGGVPHEYLTPVVEKTEGQTSFSVSSTCSTSAEQGIVESSVDFSCLSQEVMQFSTKKPSSVHSDGHVVPPQPPLTNLHTASLPNFSEQLKLQEHRPRGGSFTQSSMVERPLGDGEQNEGAQVSLLRFDSRTPSLTSSDFEGGDSEEDATPTECSSNGETLSDTEVANNVGERLGIEGQEDSRQPAKLLPVSVLDNRPLLEVGDGEGSHGDDIVSARDSPSGYSPHVSDDHLRGNGEGDGVDDLSSDGEIPSEGDTPSVSSDSVSEPQPRMTHPELQNVVVSGISQAMLERESVLRPPIVAGREVTERKTVLLAPQAGMVSEVLVPHQPQLEGESIPVTLPSASSARSCFLSGGSLIHSDHKRPVVLGEKEGEQDLNPLLLKQSTSEGYFSTPVTPKESQELVIGSDELLPYTPSNLHQPPQSGIDPHQPPQSSIDPHQPPQSSIDPHQPPQSSIDPHQPPQSSIDPHQPPQSSIDPHQPPQSSIDPHQPPQSSIEPHEPPVNSTALHPPLGDGKDRAEDVKEDFQTTSSSLPEASNVLEQLAMLYPTGGQVLEVRESGSSTVSDLSSEESLDFGISQASNPFDAEFPSKMSGVEFDSLTAMNASTLQHQLDQEESVINKFAGVNETFSRWSNVSLQTSQQVANITGTSGTLNQSVGAYFAKKSANLAQLGLPPSPETYVALTEEDTPSSSGDEQDNTLVGTMSHDSTVMSHDTTIKSHDTPALSHETNADRTLVEVGGVPTQSDSGTTKGTCAGSQVKLTFPSSAEEGFTDLTFVIPKLQVEGIEESIGTVDSTHTPTSVHTVPVLSGSLQHPPSDGLSDTTHPPSDGPTNTTHPPLDRPSDTTHAPSDRLPDTTHPPLDRPSDTTHPPSDTPHTSSQSGHLSFDVVASTGVDAGNHTVLVSDVSITTITGDLNLSGISIDGIQTPLSDHLTPTVSLTRPDEVVRTHLHQHNGEEGRIQGDDRGSISEFLQSSGRSTLTESTTRSSSPLSATGSEQGGGHTVFNQDDDRGSQQGSLTGSEPGSLTGSEPGSLTGSEPGSLTGSEPSSDTGSEPGSVPYKRLEESSCPSSTRSTSPTYSPVEEELHKGLPFPSTKTGLSTHLTSSHLATHVAAVAGGPGVLDVSAVLGVNSVTGVTGAGGELYARSGPYPLLQSTSSDVYAHFTALGGDLTTASTATGRAVDTVSIAGTADLHVPPTTSTADLHVPLTTSTAGVHVPPTTSTAGVHVPPTTSTAAVHVPLTTSTAGVHVPLTTSTAGGHVPLTTSTAGVHVSPTTSTADLHVPLTTSTAGVHVPPTTSTADLHVSPTTSTNCIQAQVLSVKKMLDFNVTTPSTPLSTGLQASLPFAFTAPGQRTTPITSVQRTTPIASVQRTTPIASVQRTTPIASVQRTTPITSVQRTTPITSVQRTTPITSVQRTPPIASVQRTTPITSVQRTPPIASVQRTTPITSTVLSPNPPLSTEKPSTSMKNISHSDLDSHPFLPPLTGVHSPLVSSSPTATPLADQASSQPMYQSPATTPHKNSLSLSHRYSTPHRSPHHSDVTSLSSSVGGSPRKMTARQTIRAPESVVFGRVCCVGCCLEESFTLKSSSERWSESSFSLLEVYRNGEKLPTEEYSVFTLPSVCHLKPKLSDSVKVGFVPREPGVYEAILSITTGPLMVVTSDQTTSYKTTVILKARAEDPQVKVLVGRNMSNVADFGLVQAGSSHSLKIHLLNEGLSDVPLQLMMDTTSPFWHCFTFDDVPKAIRKKTHLIPSTTCVPVVLPANPALVASLSPLKRVNSSHTQDSPSRQNHTRDSPSSLAQITSQSHSFVLKFQAPKKHTSSSLLCGPPMDVSALLVLKREEGVSWGKVLSKVELKAQVGVAKLYTPQSCQLISLSAHLGRSTSVDVPLKNAGNMPIDVALKIAPPSSSLTVTPSRLHFEEGEKLSVMVIYTAPSHKESTQHDLTMHLEPSGPVYKLKITASSAPHDKTGTTTPRGVSSVRPVAVKRPTSPAQRRPTSPVVTDRGELLCNKQFIHLGCVEEGGSSCEAIVIRSTLSAPVELSLSIGDEHSPFFLKSSHGDLSSSLSCEIGTDDVKIDVVFTPIARVCYQSKLYIRDILHNKQYKIPLCGYGGCAQVKVSNCRDTPNGIIMDCGDIVPGSRNAIKVKVVNKGGRSGFVRAACCAVQGGQLLPSNTATVIPPDCSLEPHAAKELLVICQIPTDHSLHVMEGVGSVGVAELVVTWGDELMRRRFQQSQWKDPHFSTPESILPYLQEFVDQREHKDLDVEVSSGEEEAQFFLSQLQRTSITLVGHLVEGVPTTPPHPTATGGVVNATAQTLLPRDRGTVEHVLAQTKPTVPGGESPSSHPTVSPSSIVPILSAASDLPHRLTANAQVQTTPGVRHLEAVDTLQQHQPRAQGLGDPRARGLGDPRARGLGDPRARGLGDPRYGGSWEARGQNDSRVMESPVHGEFPSLLEVETVARILPIETIIFPLTSFNSSSEQSFELCNPRSSTMTWFVSHVSAPVIRDTTSPTGSVSKESSPVFWIHQHNGVVRPHSSVKVAVTFHPRSSGTYSQMWDLCVRFKSEQSKRTTLSFVGQATPPPHTLTTSVTANHPNITPVQNTVLHHHRQGGSPSVTHHHHKQQGGSPTVTSSSGRMALHDSPSKRKSLVYFDKEVLRFPSTASGVKSSRKIKVCNGDTQAHKFTVIKPYHPFSIDHPKFELKSRQYARLPVHFTPMEPGHSFNSILAIKTDDGHQLFTMLKGKSV